MYNYRACLFVALLAFIVGLAQCQDEPKDGYLNLQAIDLNQDAEISFDEFSVFINQLQNLKDHYKAQEIEELTKVAFEMFDQNKDQRLQRKEYVEMGKHMFNMKEPKDLQQEGKETQEKEEL